MHHIALLLAKFMLWYEGLSRFWQEFVPGIVCTVVITVLALVCKLPQRLWRRLKSRREVRPDVLVDYRAFYGGELDKRHRFGFVADRVEVVGLSAGGKQELRSSAPLTALIGFIDGDGQMFILSGAAGLGKSRLLVEAAKARRRRVRFAQTRVGEDNKALLAERLGQDVRRGLVVVFDDCQEYASDFEVLAKAVLNAGARVIAATRYGSELDAAKRHCHIYPDELRLGLMENAGQVVPTGEASVHVAVAQICQGNPALAVMAYRHWERTRSLTGIEDSFGLLGSVFDELVRAGEKAGCPDAREFLAELAVRSGLWRDEVTDEKCLAAITAAGKMGYIDASVVQGRSLYRLSPDMLRDHIIRQVYVSGSELQFAFDRMLDRMPVSDAEGVIRMLGTQYRETRKEVWKEACRKVLARCAGSQERVGIGFQPPQGTLLPGRKVEIGCTAWRSFGDPKMVEAELGDFCACACSLESFSLVDMAGEFYLQTGQTERALECFQRCLELAGELEDCEYWQASALNNIGIVRLKRNESDCARQSLEEARSKFATAQNKVGQAASLYNMGLMWEKRGEDVQALECHNEALRLYRESGDQRGQARVLRSIGAIKKRSGSLREAIECQQAALELLSEAGDWRSMAGVLSCLQELLSQSGDVEQAERYGDQASKLLYDMSLPEDDVDPSPTLLPSVVREVDKESVQDPTFVLILSRVRLTDGAAGNKDLIKNQP